MPIPIPFVLFEDMIADWFKDLQIYVDNLSPVPDGDNSMFPMIGIPYHFDTTVLVSATVSQFTDYTDSEHGYGYQNIGFSHRLTLINGDLRCTNLQLQGKILTGNPGTWSKLTEAEQADALEKAQQLLQVGVHNNYPDSKIGFSSYSSGSFGFTVIGHSSTDMHYKYTDKNGEHVNSLFPCSTTRSSNTIIDNGDGTISGPFSDVISGGRNFMNITPTIVLFSSDTNAQNFVNGMQSTNRDVYNHVCVSGATYKIYVGETYLVYVIDPSKVYTFYDLYDGTKTAAQQINDWTPGSPVIKVPTYDDVKYGPEPEPTDLVSDNQEDGGNYNHAEFTKVYACTSEELDYLYQWMGGGAAGSSGTSPVTVPDNFDPMNRIVGLIGYPMIIDVGVGDATTFTFRNAANQTINTGWSTYKYGNFDRAFDFGIVDIPNWEEVNNGAPFLDYSATVEIYIPFCGVVGLDPQAVMGCTLSCKMWIDFLTGDCSAVVYTNYGGEDAQHPVAFVSGNCGSAEVVSANAFGAYQGAKAQASHKMSQAIIGGVKNLATSIIGGATTGFTRGAANPSGTGGNAGMKAGAIGSVIGGAMDLGVNLTLQNMDNQYAVQVAKNALGTTISGSFGQQTSWYYMDTPYIKVTWPTPISKDVELYGKTFGVPVHKSGALSEYTGYTVCNNVDVSGIADATASELAIIKQFLETGVFIKEGGEE